MNKQTSFDIATTYIQKYGVSKGIRKLTAEHGFPKKYKCTHPNQQTEQMENKTCPECGDIMKECEVPDEGTIFRIPFTEIDIIWRKWNVKDWVCLACESDKYNEPFRRAYEAGGQDAIEKAMQEGAIL